MQLLMHDYCRGHLSQLDMEVMIQAVLDFWYSPYGTAASVILLSVCIYWLAVMLDSLLQRKAMQQLDDFREEVRVK